jgi:RNA polymerase sigma-70 factor (ECF subfamily)
VRDQDIPDLIQDVFTLLVQKLPEFTYDSSKSFQGWLRTVTLNKWRERFRKPALPGSGDDGRLASVASPDPAETFWETEYRQHLVRQALEIVQHQFQATSWKACWEHVVEGKPVAQVAAELKMTPGGVRAAKFRVLARLRQELRGLLD